MTRALLTLLLSVPLAVLLVVGCETQSADAPITVSPYSVELRRGQSQTFTAEGGYDYRWSLSQPSWGELSATTGDRVTYTARYEPAEDTTRESRRQTLTVQSYILGSGGDGTNDVPDSAVAKAYVIHL